MNELHPDWNKEANDRINPDIKENSLGKAINNGKKQSFIQGATLMRDRVVKAIAIERTCYEDPLADIVLDRLLETIQNITPND